MYLKGVAPCHHAGIRTEMYREIVQEDGGSSWMYLRHCTHLKAHFPPCWLCASQHCIQNPPCPSYYTPHHITFDTSFDCFIFIFFYYIQENMPIAYVGTQNFGLDPFSWSFLKSSESFFSILVIKTNDPSTPLCQSIPSNRGATWWHYWVFW